MTPGSGSFEQAQGTMAQWHHKILETLAVQGSHSAVHCYIAGTVLLAELTPREVKIKTFVYSEHESSAKPVS